MLHGLDLTSTGWCWRIYLFSFEKEKEEIWFIPMTKVPTATEKNKKKKQRDNAKNATKNVDYTTIADRLRTVSWSNDSHPTGVVKPVYGIPTFQLTAKAAYSKGTKEYSTTLDRDEKIYTSVNDLQSTRRFVEFLTLHISLTRGWIHVYSYNME